MNYIDDPLFVGRQAEKTIFSNFFTDRWSTNRPSFIHYYGISGIGKTYLKDHIVASLRATSFPGDVSPYLAFTSLNFNPNQTTKIFNASPEVLLRLRKELNQQGVSTLLFDMAYLMYYEKTREDTISPTRYEKELKRVDIWQSILDIVKDGIEAVEKNKLTAASLSGLLATLGASSAAISAPVVAGVLGSAVLVDAILSMKLIKLLHDLGAARIKPGKYSLDEVELRRFSRNYTDVEMRGKLSVYLGQDIQRYIQNNNQTVTLSIFVDSYDRLLDGVPENRYNEKDEWLRLLIEYAPNVVWVVFSTTTRTWIQVPKPDSSNNNFPLVNTRHLLEELADNEVRLYLSTQGIDNQLIPLLVSELGGLPWLMKGKAAQAVAITSSITPLNSLNLRFMAQDHEEIVNRYLANYSDDHAYRSAFDVLAVFEHWTQHLFNVVVNQFSSYSPEGCAELKRKFVFITLDSTARYRMPTCLRKSLLSLKDDAFVRRVKKFALEQNLVSSV